MSAKRSAQKQRRHLASVTPAQVEAQKSCDPDTLARLVTLTRLLAQDTDVREHAGIIVAACLPRATDEQHAARTAVAIARRAVASSRALEAWDCYGDMTEEVTVTIEDCERRTGATRYAPDPANSPLTRITYGDLVATILAGQRTGVGEELRAACLAYVAHAQTCEECSEASSRRVTLAGVRAHMDGRGAEDASYHAERRAVLRALKRVGTFDDLARTIGDAAPMALAHVPHGRVSLGSIRKDSTRDQLAPVRTVLTEATREEQERALTVTRTYAEPNTREWNTRAVRHAARALDAAMREARQEWERVTGNRAHAVGTIDAHHNTTSTGWHMLDALGYRAAYGYAPSPMRERVAACERALADAEREAVTYGETVTREEPRTYTTTRATHAAPRAMRKREEEALRATLERAARHAGEEYRGDTRGPASGQADAFGHAPRAEANTGRAVTPGEPIRSGKVEPSPRKRPRTGSTGPTIPAW